MHATRSSMAAATAGGARPRRQQRPDAPFARRGGVSGTRRTRARACAARGDNREHSRHTHTFLAVGSPNQARGRGHCRWPLRRRARARHVTAVYTHTQPDRRARARLCCWIGGWRAAVAHRGWAPSHTARGCPLVLGASLVGDERARERLEQWCSLAPERTGWVGGSGGGGGGRKRRGGAVGGGGAPRGIADGRGVAVPQLAAACWRAGEAMRRGGCGAPCLRIALLRCPKCRRDGGGVCSICGVRG